MKETDTNIRRRGDALTDSIYDATVKVIREVGYPKLTFKQIALTAKTSRTVLYRRWTTTFDLIYEIMVYKMSMVLGGDLIDRIEDTGSLRGDLLQLLTLYQRVYAEVTPEIMNAFLFELSQNSEEISGVRINAKKKNIKIMLKLLGFAKSRGEKTKEVSELTLTLPFDLIRMDYIMTEKATNSRRLELLVDEILLPVFKS